MGYFEIFCLACGGPCTSFFGFDEQYEDAETRNEKTRIKKLENKLMLINLKWIEKMVVVTKNGTFSGRSGFDDSEFPASIGNLDLIDPVNVETQPPVVIPESIWCTSDHDVYGFHYSCWKVLNEPTYEYLTSLKLKRNSGNTVVCKVYPLNHLMNQSFDYIDLKQSELKFLYDPLANIDNANNVRNTWDKVIKCVE